MFWHRGFRITVVAMNRNPQSIPNPPLYGSRRVIRLSSAPVCLAIGLDHPSCIIQTSYHPLFPILITFLIIPDFLDFISSTFPRQSLKPPLNHFLLTHLSPLYHSHVSTHFCPCLWPLKLCPNLEGGFPLPSQVLMLAFNRRPPLFQAIRNRPLPASTRSRRRTASTSRIATAADYRST